MTEFVLSILLTIAPSLYPQVETWLLLASPHRIPDTPASDVVLLRHPYVMAKDHSLGPGAPTELVERGRCRGQIWIGLDWGWVCSDGLTCPTICGDAQQIAVVGTWLVVRDRQGQCLAFDTTKQDYDPSPPTTLDGVNDHLARYGVGPLTDADFRTFEELMAERERRRVTWSLVGLAVGLTPLAVVVLVVFVRRRG